MDRPDATALVKNKRYVRNGDFLKKITGNKEMVKTGFSYSNFRFFFCQENKQTKLY